MALQCAAVHLRAEVHAVTIETAPQVVEIVCHGRAIRSVVAPNGCHLCVSHRRKSPKRYPLMFVDGKPKIVSRAVYETVVGPIPEGC